MASARPQVVRPGAAVLGGAAVCLAVLGLLLIASAANTPAAGRWGRPPSGYVSRQLLCATLAFCVGGLLHGLGRARLERLALPSTALWLGLSALTLVPGVGIRFGGATRQLGIEPWTLQPTIVLAASLPLLVAARGAGWGALAAALGGLVCLKQPNFGHLGTLLVTLLGALAGLGARRALRWTGLAFVACGPLALSFPYVRWRVASFLDPGLTRDTTALQGIARDASWLGAGLGQGTEKGSLSAAPTDYMFAATLEELGWLGALGALALLVGCAAQAWRLAPAGDRAARAAAGGVAAFLLFPAAIHVAVCLRLFPVTGIHLPFLSYSGSCLLALGLATGSLLGLTRSPAGAGVGSGQPRGRA